MYLTKETLNSIAQKYNITFLTEDDVVNAFNFVHDVLVAEADAIKAKEPTATASISRLESAAYEVFSVGGEIENEEFDEGSN